MSKEAMKLALEALKRSVATCFDQYAHEQVMSQPDHFINQAIKALEKALANQEQGEPVACERCKQLEEQAYDLLGQLKVANIKLAYTTPQQRTWAGLTYEEESELIRLAHNHAGIRFYIQAAEAKLKEKNNG
jgi:hypothetical protein